MTNDDEHATFVSATTGDETLNTKREARLAFDVSRLAPAIVSGLLIAVLYGYVLGLPFYFDDLPVLEWLEGRSLAEAWTRSNENAYYRPLTFSLYKLALYLPKGVQQVALHGANLVLHWAAAVGVGWLARAIADGWRTADGDRRPTMGDGQLQKANRDRQGRSCFPPVDLTEGTGGGYASLFATVLYAVFPFFFRAVPWVTAMPHFLVVLLCLIAALAALRAVDREEPAWWGASLAATALAPFAHESGLACGAIVGGLVLLRPALRRNWGRLAWAAGGVALNVGALVVRGLVPGAGAFMPVGLRSPVENALFGLHGLIYPLGPAIGWLVRRGGHDLSLVGGAAALCALLLAYLAWRTRSWRWIAESLWWWVCASLPSLLAFRYGALVNSPRFYALPAVGIVTLWAGALACLSDPKGIRRITRKPLGAETQTIAIVLVAAIGLSNALFLWQQRQVHRDLFGLYRQIIAAAAEPEDAPLGYVNVPAWLTPKTQTYALTKDGAIGLALYNDVQQLVRVNLGTPIPATNVMHVHTLYEPQEAYFGFHGDWLEGPEMRRFAIDHRSVWLVRYRQDARAGARFELQHVGTVLRNGGACSGEPLVGFENGPGILSAALVQARESRQDEDGRTAIAFTWRADAPIQASVFVHVVDAQGGLVTQADGPALGGLLPPTLWQPGDCIYDVRTLYLPSDSRPLTVLAGLYDAQGRFPAYVGGTRAPNDAAPVVTIVR